ncbi:hypothetical protein TRVL_07274 [Trypanosoma vivax]|nr:hypothetical protein TRVL_07274 [Trypanosoma vivax]
MQLVTAPTATIARRPKRAGACQVLHDCRCTSAVHCHWGAMNSERHHPQRQRDAFVTLFMHRIHKCSRSYLPQPDLHTGAVLVPLILYSLQTITRLPSSAIWQRPSI